MSRHLLEPLPPVGSAQESSEREGESGAWPGFFPTPSKKKGGTWSLRIFQSGRFGGGKIRSRTITRFKGYISSASFCPIGDLG